MGLAQAITGLELALAAALISFRLSDP